MKNKETYFLYADGKIDKYRPYSLPVGVVYHRFDDGECLALSLKACYGDLQKFNKEHNAGGVTWRLPTHLDFMFILRELCRIEFKNADAEWYVSCYGHHDEGLDFDKVDLCRRLMELGVEISTSYSYQGDDVGPDNYGEIWTLDMMSGTLGTDEPYEEYRFYNPIPYAILPVCNVTM